MSEVTVKYAVEPAVECRPCSLLNPLFWVRVRTPLFAIALLKRHVFPTEIKVSSNETFQWFSAYKMPD